MRAPRHVLILASLATACVLIPAVATAGVPPFKGNDTGGIIAWTYAAQIDARKLAIEHCAHYGKLMKPLASQRYYGGYISFACVWPKVRIEQVLRVRG